MYCILKLVLEKLYHVMNYEDRYRISATVDLIINLCSDYLLLLYFRQVVHLSDFPSSHYYLPDFS
jgi:hypothetical protein